FGLDFGQASNSQLPLPLPSKSKGDMLQFLEYGEQLWDVCRTAGFEKEYRWVQGMVKEWRDKLNR
ncbi:hypothetical protein HDU98_001879, partial [Podochytrium sp. JEL0797]